MLMNESAQSELSHLFIQQPPLDSKDASCFRFVPLGFFKSGSQQLSLHLPNYSDLQDFAGRSSPAALCSPFFAPESIEFPFFIRLYRRRKS
jgi:hypothetical protein